MAGADDTIVALSSGRPPAGIAVIRLSGPRAVAAAQALAGDIPAPRTAALRRFRDPFDGRHLDQGLLLHFPGPGSVTGEDVVEFHCHGGRAIVDALLGALLEQDGVRLAEPGEFTRRALASGRIDLTEAEGLADLLAAETEAQRRAAIMVAEGGLRRRLEQWRERLLGLSAQVEVAIDYADEEDGASGDPGLTVNIAALAAEIRELLDQPTVDPLHDGIRVVVAGPPNAGKSSLINALSNSDRSIVTPIAGTTRDSIEVPLAIGGTPFILIDTAGLRDSDDPVETLGVERANKEIERADLVIWLGKPGPVWGKSLQVSPKADLGRATGDGFAVSALTGEGIDKLRSMIVSVSEHLVPPPDQLSLNRRQHGHLQELCKFLQETEKENDLVLVGEQLRLARQVLDEVTGRSGLEDLLDALFGRFCLGK